jgi:hypothetical protein
MTSLEHWELASYIVTVIGLPLAIIVYLLDQRKERQNEEEEIYQRLSDEYADFSQLLLKHADLQLLSKESANMTFSPEDLERKKIIFDILISLFERAFILVYNDKMNKQTQRLWASWEDYIKFWCARKDFRDALPELLQGEDPDFGVYIRKILSQVDTKN